MKKNTTHKNQKQFRLQAWDYRWEGLYFITICTKNRACSLGRIYRESVFLSRIGKVVEKYWTEIPNHFKNIHLKKWVVMPNHIHGIIKIEYKENKFSNQWSDRAKKEEKEYYQKFYNYLINYKNQKTKNGKYFSMISPKSGSLSTIIGSFKSAVSKHCNQNNLNFSGWQPRFHDHIIKDNDSLHNILDYIENNPKEWKSDRNNLDNLT